MPEDRPKVAVLGELASRAEPISNILVKLVPLSGDRGEQQDDVRILVPFVEFQLSTPAQNGERETRCAFHQLITLHNAAFLLYDMANDLAWAAKELRAFAQGDLKPLRTELDGIQEFAQKARDRCDALAAVLGEIGAADDPAPGQRLEVD